jgi:hypothetical protein
VPITTDVLSSNPVPGEVFSSTTLCDKVCQWLATGQWFSLSTPVSSTNKTGRHDVNEILLKVALNPINQSKPSIFWISFCCTWCTLFQKRVVRTKLYNLHFYSTFFGGVFRQTLISSRAKINIDFHLARDMMESVSKLCWPQRSNGNNCCWYGMHTDNRLYWDIRHTNDVWFMTFFCLMLSCHMRRKCENSNKTLYWLIHVEHVNLQISSRWNFLRLIEYFFLIQINL